MKIISGMHRSGSSLVARLFFESGADMGSPSDFYPADRWNPKGYFEQRDILNINMSLINGMWWKFAYFFPPSRETIMKRALRCSEEIREAAERYRNCTVKENRFSLTLPAWLEYGAQVEGILVCLRNPMHVAHSLRKRNRLSINRGLGLWLLHNMRLMESAGEIPLWFIRYDNLLDSEKYLAETSAALRFFGIDRTEGEVSEIWGKCVDHRMDHHSIENEPMPREIDVLWSQLLDRHKKQF